MCKLHVYICHHLSSQVNLDVNWMFDSAQRIKCCYLQLGARANSLTKRIIRPLLRVQNVMRPRRECRALGDSLLALTSQRVLMELVINPLLSVTGSAACLCIRALGSSVLVLLWGGPRGGKYTKRIVVINHVKLKPVAASASFFLLPFPSTFDAFILFSNLVSINNGRRWGQQDPGGPSARRLG